MLLRSGATVADTGEAGLQIERGATENEPDRLIGSSELVIAAHLV